MRAPLYTDIGDPIERLSAIVSHTQQKKAVQKGVVMPILLGVVDNLPGALLGVAARGVVLAGSRLGELAPCNTMLTNVPGPARPYYMLGAQCVHTTGCAPMMDGGGLLNSVHATPAASSSPTPPARVYSSNPISIGTASANRSTN